ncbi:MAG: response regulator [Calditrichia bacterium]
MASMQKRVLIVDDEEDLTWTLSKKLSRDSDKFQVITVNSGREAIDVLNQVPIDLVISDVRMPEVSGLELLVEIKEKYPQTKVIIMTAYGSSDVQRSASERGSFRYIEKPFEINELRELILEGLKEKKGFKGSVSDFQLGDIIQLNCLGRLTSALQIKQEAETGTIYFQEGNIVHAETGSLSGENAFYYIMSWPGGEFSVRRNAQPPRETISKGWQSLLLEAMRRLDESSGLAVEEKEQEKQSRLNEIHLNLNPVFKTRGVDFILIHNSAGFPITFLPSNEESNLEAIELGNQLSVFLNDLKKLQKHLQTTPPGLLEIQFGNLFMITNKIPDKDAYITVLGDHTLNVGFVRFELRKIVKEIGEMV